MEEVVDDAAAVQDADQLVPGRLHVDAVVNPRAYIIYKLGIEENILIKRYYPNVSFAGQLMPGGARQSNVSFCPFWFLISHRATLLPARGDSVK